MRGCIRHPVCFHKHSWTSSVFLVFSLLIDVELQLLSVMNRLLFNVLVLYLVVKLGSNGSQTPQGSSKYNLEM